MSWLLGTCQDYLIHEVEDFPKLQMQPLYCNLGCTLLLRFVIWDYLFTASSFMQQINAMRECLILLLTDQGSTNVRPPSIQEELFFYSQSCKFKITISCILISLCISSGLFFLLNSYHLKMSMVFLFLCSNLTGTRPLQYHINESNN